MASQTPFQSTKQREERIFFASFYLHSLLRVFAGAHEHLALYHLYVEIAVQVQLTMHYCQVGIIASAWSAESKTAQKR